MTKNFSKGIDTHYNGYKFRSRTEARWAVFFDELHIAYEYEPKGFDLKGVRYLPDFQFIKGLILHNFEPTQLDQIWVEIKPVPELSDDERKKMAEFVRQTDHHILLIAGQPDINATLRFIDHHPKTGWFIIDVRWLELPDGQIGLVPIEYLNKSELLTQTNTPRLRYALDKARQSRFEFGQTPVPPPTLPPNTPPPEQKEPKASAKKSYKKPKPKECKSCGKTFKPYRPHFIYCSSCYHKQKRQETTVEPLAAPIPAKQTQQSESIAAEKQSPLSKSRNWKTIIIGLIISGLIILGIWFLITLPSIFATPTATATKISQPTSTAVSTPRPTTKVDLSTCSCSKNSYDCTDFNNQAEAQACFDHCFEIAGDVHSLDGNEDGQACESLP